MYGMAYLCFSDFERSVASKAAPSRIQDIAPFQAGGLSAIPSVLGIGKCLYNIPNQARKGINSLRSLEHSPEDHVTPR